jgi:DNA polymerase
MTDRRETLEELGLAPIWRQRTGAPGTRSVAPEQVATPATVARAAVGAPANGPAAEATPTHEASHDAASCAASTGGAPGRAERIAALDWDPLVADIDACTACGLCRSRNRSVPGVGDRHAEWLFVGEGPGAEEDARGEPFVGLAGKLLDNMLAALAMSRREKVYIANVVKCRPPGNRTPEPVEAEACRPYLERQIGLLQPRIVVALGRSAASLLLGTDASIASLRGKVHRYGAIPLVVTYHPAYLLRTPLDKAKAWEDLLLARRAARAEGVALA